MIVSIASLGERVRQARSLMTRLEELGGEAGGATGADSAGSASIEKTEDPDDDDTERDEGGAAPEEDEDEDEDDEYGEERSAEGGADAAARLELLQRLWASLTLLKAELAILQGVDESGLAVSLGEKLSRRHHERELLRGCAPKEAVGRMVSPLGNECRRGEHRAVGIAEDEINEPPLSLKAPTQKKRASLVIPQHEPQRPEAPTNP